MADDFRTTDERVLVVAPTGRDATLIKDTLAKAGYNAEIFPTVETFCDALNAGGALAALEEEILTPAGLRCIETVLSRQPAWSDFPFLVLPRKNLLTEGPNPRFAELRSLQNFTILERPLYPARLIAAVETAYRARHRQYDARRYLLEREADHYQIAELNRELEQRVKDRTDEIVKVKEAFYQAQKLEAIARLAGGVAHDFNNLMTGILAITEEVHREVGPGSKHADDLAEVIKAAQKASGLTRQLLAFGRKQIVQEIVVNFNRIIIEMNRIFERLLGEDVQIETRLDPAVGNIKADPGSLEQVIVNLMLNSRDAMPSGGKILLATENIFVEQPSTSNPTLPRGEYIRVSVSDTGTGIPKEIIDHIFEPFFTTKEQGKGTGLGLATVYGIVKQWGGEVTVRTTLGKGTTFELYFPRIRAEVDVDRRTPIGGTVVGGQETILIVEDEDIVRRVAVKALQKSGYSVLQATNGKEAIDLLSHHGPEVDLLLTDVVMPGINGRQVAHHFEAAFPKKPVLFMSGHPQDIIFERGILDPGIAFIEKSFSVESLCIRVRDLLDRQVEKRP